MVTRVVTYLTRLVTPLVKAAGTDRMDGVDLNNLIDHVSMVAKLTSADSPFTPQKTDTFFQADCSSGSITINLLAASQVAGKPLYFKRIDKNPMTSTQHVLTVVGTIDYATKILFSGSLQGGILYSDGTQYWVLL